MPGRDTRIADTHPGAVALPPPILEQSPTTNPTLSNPLLLPVIASRNNMLTNVRAARLFPAPDLPSTTTRSPACNFPIARTTGIKDGTCDAARTILRGAFEVTE